MAYVWAAFVMGLAGGVHCLLMCGPLAMSALNMRNGTINRLGAILLYQGGRISAYLIIGLIFGALGKVVSMLFYQQVLSILSGFLLLLWVSSYFFKRISIATKALRLWSKLTTALSAALWKKKTKASVLGLGVLNGFLPCGLVYLAATASLNQGSMGYSALFMLFFGIGTLPAMIGIVYSKKLIPTTAQSIFKKASPVFLTILGVLFICRGLDLDIPYLSPHISQTTTGTVNSCHTQIPLCR
jgi:sulfite exporter TauE/SafE